jgi:DNA-binding NarL/FixJ family response regulator
VPDPVRVVIGEDDVLMREGIARLLTEAGFEVAAQASDAEEFLRKALAHRPDVAVVDVRMPPGRVDDGLRAALELRRERPETGVLVLSQYYDERYAVDLIGDRADGVGYLLKERVGDVDVFTDAVARVAAGGSALDTEIVSRMLGRRRQESALADLTPREREVLAAMAEGKSNQGIAATLFVTEPRWRSTSRASSTSCAWSLPPASTGVSAPCSDTSRTLPAEGLATRLRPGSCSTGSSRTDRELAKPLDARPEGVLLALVHPAAAHARVDHERRLAVVVDRVDRDAHRRVVGRAGHRLLDDRRAATRGERDVAFGQHEQRDPRPPPQPLQRSARAVQAQQDLAVAGPYGSRHRDRVRAVPHGGEDADRASGPRREHDGGGRDNSHAPTVRPSRP